jgi:hypothetical protein
MLDPLSAAITQFNQLNSEDPTLIQVGGETRPRELVQAERLEEWVLQVDPHASSALRLASRCQHLKRFAFPRSDYPEGRVGYLKWRKDLSKKHADLATQVLSGVGADPALISQVRAIVLKQAQKANPDGQAMEDALCLSFLQHEFSEFAAKHPDDKVVDIVRKTWGKMSARGHELALGLPLTGRAQALVEKALSGA